MAADGAAGNDVESWLAALTREGTVARSNIPLTLAELQAMGFWIEGERVSLPIGCELLDPERIRAALPETTRSWLQSLHCFPVLDSTNAWLAHLAVRGEVHGVAVTAEMQTAGRGRRGRSWHSPFAQNIALSVGYSFDVGASALSGYSLIVGLGVLDALESLGVPGATLKWPNDIRVGSAKLAGILVELIPASDRLQVVVGVGINYRLSAAARKRIDQPVYELADLPHPPSRNALVAALVHHIRVYSGEFSELGFAPFKAAFNAHHGLHGRPATVQGAVSVDGVVLGVDDEGALLLETAEGVASYSGGDVSLRGS